MWVHKTTFCYVDLVVESCYKIKNFSLPEEFVGLVKWVKHSIEGDEDEATGEQNIIGASRLNAAGFASMGANRLFWYGQDQADLLQQFRFQRQ